MYKALFLLLTIQFAGVVHGSDSLFFYSDGKRCVLEVDRSRLMVKWKPFIGSIEESGYLDPYPALVSSSPRLIGQSGYFLHTMRETAGIDSLITAMNSDSNVVAINPVLKAGQFGLFYFGDEIICRFESDVSDVFIDSICRTNGLEIIEESRYMPRQFLLKITSESSLGTLDMANYLWELQETKWAHPNFEEGGSFQGYSIQDSLFHAQHWAAKTTVGYKNTSNYGAWEITRGSADIKVAVLDDGFEWHEDFDTSLWVFRYDAYANDSNPEPDPSIGDNTNHHGMAVLGLIASKHNNLVTDPIGNSRYASTAGLSSNVKIIPVKMGANWNIGNTNVTSTAINHARSKGAHVISGSWGYLFPPYAVPDVLRNAVDSATIYGRSGKGCILVFAAGNGVGYPDTLLYPANDSNVISVGAIQTNDIRFSYSQYQAGVLDLMAPSGAQFTSSPEYSCPNTFYTVDRMANSGWSPDLEPPCFPSQDDDYVFSFSGTSASTPQVSAVAALVLSKDSTLTRVQVMKLLKNSAVKSLAWGNIPPDSTPYYGAGRVNAARALSAFYKGDCNLSGGVNVVDLTLLTNFLFNGGPEPYPEKVYGDADCTWSTNVGDLTYIVAYLFQGGPAPVKPCIGN